MTIEVGHIVKNLSSNEAVTINQIQPLGTMVSLKYPIMTGLLIKELVMRELVERILIITPGGLTKQWQEDEMGLKFSIPFTLVNRSLFSADPNVFHTTSRIVTSIDFDYRIRLKYCTLN